MREKRSTKALPRLLLLLKVQTRKEKRHEKKSVHFSSQRPHFPLPLPVVRASPAVALYLRAVKCRTSASYPHAARGACEPFAGSSKTALDNAARKQHFISRCILARARPAQTTIQHMHTSN
jgi:hypothetical protein